MHHPIPGTAGTCSTFSGMAGTSPELISNRSEAVRTLTLVSTAKSLCQLLLKCDLSGVQIEAGCLGRLCGMTPETFALLVCTAESENRNNPLKTSFVEKLKLMWVLVHLLLCAVCSQVSWAQARQY